VVEKNTINPTLYPPERFYPKFLTMVLNFVLRKKIRPGTPQILIYTDSLPFPKPQAKAVEVAIKSSCRKETKLPFLVLHHRIESNNWIQVADYCSWAVCRKWEGQDGTFYDRIKVRIAAPEISPMDRGDQTYY